MSRYHAILKIQCMIMEPRDAASASVGILLLFTCMQSRMVNIYNLLSEYERQIRQSRRRRRYNPYRWRLPRPNGSWFEIHYRNRAIPPNYFKSQLPMKRDTFDVLLNMLTPFLLRQNTSLRDCIPPEKVLALGLYRLAHGN